MPYLSTFFLHVLCAFPAILIHMVTNSVVSLHFSTENLQTSTYLPCSQIPKHLIQAIKDMFHSLTAQNICLPDNQCSSLIGLDTFQVLREQKHDPSEHQFGKHCPILLEKL